jgi:hypothetical protein
MPVCVMAHKNERVELEMQISKYRNLLNRVVDDEFVKRAKGEDRGTGAEAPGDRRVGRLSWRPPSRKQIRPGLREIHVSPGFVHHQPTALDRKFEPGAVFRWRSLEFIQKRPVDFLDMDVRPGRGLMCSRLYLACQPTHRIGLHRVYGKTELFSKVAGGALKRALLIAPLAGRDARKPHPVLTGRTHRPIAINTHHSVPGSQIDNLKAALHSV